MHQKKQVDLSLGFAFFNQRPFRPDLDCSFLDAASRLLVDF